jgi:hypothetical protein
MRPTLTLGRDSCAAVGPHLPKFTDLSNDNGLLQALPRVLQCKQLFIYFLLTIQEEGATGSFKCFKIYVVV